MAESIVKVPQCAADDMDFLAFSFNGKHSWDDFGIYRTIDGDRYNENFAPTLNDKTAEVPGGDGMYYFGTTHKQRDFNISFAFDHLEEAQLREMKKWLNGKEMGDLWFSEAPYKVWTAKPSGNSAIKYIPFDDEDGQRVYKGEGTIQFTAYWPYAHTPDLVHLNVPGFEVYASGKELSSYEQFTNKNQWSAASGLTNTFTPGDNKGDLPTPFVLKQDGFIPAGTIFTVGEAEITTTSDCYNLEWDSKTGLVIAGNSATITDKKDKKPINVLGNSCSAIPVDGVSEIKGEVEISNKTETIAWETTPTTETTEPEIIEESDYENYDYKTETLYSVGVGIQKYDSIVDENEEPREWISVREPNEDEDEGEYFYQNDFIATVGFEEGLTKEEKADENGWFYRLVKIPCQEFRVNKEYYGKRIDDTSYTYEKRPTFIDKNKLIKEETTVITETQITGQPKIIDDYYLLLDSGDFIFYFQLYRPNNNPKYMLTIRSEDNQGNRLPTQSFDLEGITFKIATNEWQDSLGEQYHITNNNGCQLYLTPHLYYSDSENAFVIGLYMLMYSEEGATEPLDILNMYPMVCKEQFILYPNNEDCGWTDRLYQIETNQGFITISQYSKIDTYNGERTIREEKKKYEYLPNDSAKITTTIYENDSQKGEPTTEALPPLSINYHYWYY